MHSILSVSLGQNFPRIFIPILIKHVASPVIDARATFAKKAEAGGLASLGKVSKKKLGKLGPLIEKKVMPVEEDTDILVSHLCGSNLLKEGKDIKLKADEEYPDWLWTLRTGKPPPLNEVDPESKEYWTRVRKLGMQRNNKLAKLKRF